MAPVRIGSQFWKRCHGWDQREEDALIDEGLFVWEERGLIIGDQGSRTKSKGGERCEVFLHLRTPSLFSMHEKTKRAEVYILTEGEVARLRRQSRGLIRLRPGCRLPSRVLSLTEVIPRSSLVRMSDGSTRACFYHGTLSRQLLPILRSGLRPWIRR